MYRGKALFAIAAGLVLSLVVPASASVVFNVWDRTLVFNGCSGLSSEGAYTGNSVVEYSTYPRVLARKMYNPADTSTSWGGCGATSGSRCT